MEVIGYVRVSTEEQAREGLSVEAQKEKIKAYCQLKDWTLKDIISDEGRSGKNLNREGIQAIIKMIIDNEIEGLVVYKLDRLTRSVKDLNFLIELLEKKQIKLISITENLDTSTASGRFFVNILGTISQWEREIIGERTKLALHFKREKKEKYSREVFGFDFQGGRMVENQKEQAIIKEMIKLKQAGLSYREIAKHLKTKGIKTKRGGEWQAGNVYVILKKYKGEVC